jgi:hypothetical protein
LYQFAKSYGFCGKKHKIGLFFEKFITFATANYPQRPGGGIGRHATLRG